jgi:hypothetical protein
MANYSKTQEIFEKEVNKAPGLKYEKKGRVILEEAVGLPIHHLESRTQ